ncbi:CaiB/BaiF CoA transferase family protein [Formosa sp. A9]|uniref:CaiB/BaiF CoA transferase family protein n=1 Tax=Formosa sp. A9 TaxID=3442641 RepID=UPI003EB6A2C9
MKPLEGILVVEFCQFLAGPSAGLRLADLGARVIKIERPIKGEGGRQIAIKNLFIEGDSLVFHTINRNKQSFAANLKDPEDLKRIKKILEVADIMTHNFRPGVMEAIGLDYKTVKQLNSRIIYGVVTGYGSEGPWQKKPGQDLLIQAMSGLAYLSGTAKDHPTPMGIAASDIFTGTHFTQGLLAALVRRGKTNEGALVEVSLLESTIDMQFEVLTTYLNDGGKPPKRAKNGNAQAYLGAPYGVYKTKDSYIAIAMVPMTKLETHLKFELPEHLKSEANWFDFKDEIMTLIQAILKEKTTKAWLDILEPADIWCSAIFNYKELMAHDAYKILQMDQDVITASGVTIKTTRCPIQIDSQYYYASKAAPKVGEDNETIVHEFGLQNFNNQNQS